MSLLTYSKTVRLKLKPLFTLHCHLSHFQDREIKMSSRTKLKPHILVEETFDKTKKFFTKTIRNLKSFLSGEYKKGSFHSPIFSCGKKINSQLQDLDNFCRSFSEKWEANEVLKKEEAFLLPKERTNENEKCSKSSISVSKIDLKEEKNASNHTIVKLERSGSMASDSLAKKMKELDMMDVNDDDHVLDIEEVLQSYSSLTCPTYVEMVDSFFMDMYLEYHLPMPTRSRSMRKLRSGSVHGSMRNLGPGSVHGSMRNPGQGSVHGSMRNLGPGSVHGSTRNLGSGSVHSSMRSLGPIKI